MIVFLEGKDSTVEVPDDITDGQLSDISNNFSSYTNQPEQKDPVAASTSPGTPTAPEISKKPNFYEGYIRPNLSSISSVLALTGLPLTTNEEKMSPQAGAFAGKALEEATFGISKPLFDPILEKSYKEHPVFADVGQFTGGLGSLLMTGAAIKAAGLGKVAAGVGEKAVEMGIPSGSRYIPSAIMQGATFGTKTFISKTVESFQKGGVDIADFGESVLKDTAFGSTFGAISGIPNPAPAIASAAGLGFVSARMEGADNAHAVLNGAIWAAFETVGSFGRDIKIKTAAVDNLAKSIGEYVEKTAPGKFGKDGASILGKAIIEKEAVAQGFENTEALIKSGPENTLKAIESINQKVRQSLVDVKPKGDIPTKPLELGNERPAPVDVTPKESPEQAELNKMLGTSELQKTPMERPDVMAKPMPVPEESIYPKSSGIHENLANAEYDDAGIPKLKPTDVVSNMVASDGTKITHGDVLLEAEAEKAVAMEQWQEVKRMDFIKSLGKLRWTEDEKNNGGWNDRPWTLRKIVFTKDRSAVNIDEKAQEMGITSDELRQQIFEAWDKAQRAPSKDTGTYYHGALNSLETLYSQTNNMPIEPNEAPLAPEEEGEVSGPVEMEPGVMFEKTKTQYGGMEPAPTFYSKMDQTVQEKMPAKAPPEQIMGLLRNAGVKQDEMDWMGIEDFLKDKKSVTKEELFNFIKENKVDIQEVQKGDKSSDLARRFAQQIEEKGYDVRFAPDMAGEAEGFEIWKGDQLLQDEDLPRPVRNLSELLQKAISKTGTTDTKFQEYTLPGGENYRELLLTLPNDKMAPGFNAIQMPDGSWGVKFPNGDTFGGWRTRQDAIDSQRRQPGSPTFESSHFPERNILAHVRFNDRLLFDSPSSTIEAKGKEARADSLAADAKFLSNIIKSPSFTKKGLSGLDIENRKSVISSVVRSVSDPEIRRNVISLIPVDVMDDLIRTKFTPDQFLSDKTMLTDSLSSNPNATIRLSESTIRGLVSSIADLATKRISIPPNSSGVPIADSSAPSTRDSHIGKRTLFIEEIQSDWGQAKRAGKDVPEMPFSKTWHELALKRMLRYAAENGYDKIAWTTGEQQAERYPRENDAEKTAQLKGMAGFYDQMIPSFLNKYAKKWGGRVGEATINESDQSLHVELSDDGKTYSVVNSDDPMVIPIEEFNTESQAQSYVDKHTMEEQKVPALDITPSMKESVMTEGQPLFEKPLPFGEENIASPNAEKDQKEISQVPGGGGASQPAPAEGRPAPKAVYSSDFAVEYRKVGKLVIPGRKATTPQDFGFIFKGISDPTKENSYIAAFKNGKVVGVQQISIGTIDQVNLYPFETIELIAKTGADSIIDAHNHPSGYVDPSQPDRELSKAIKQVAENSGIKYIGQVIINDTKFGFGDGTGQYDTFTHREYEKTKTVDVLQSYGKWLKRGEKKPAIFNPTKAFELFKGIQTGKDQGMMILLNVQNEIQNAFIVPHGQFDAKTVQKLASENKSVMVIFVNANLEVRETTELMRQLRPSGISILDDIVMSPHVVSRRETMEIPMAGENKRAMEQGGELYGTPPKENIAQRYDRLKKQAIEQGMTPGQALTWARQQLSKPIEQAKTPKPQQTEFGAGGVQSFGKGKQGEPDFFPENYPSTKGTGRQYAEPGDEVASLKKKIGGIEFIKRVRGPELVKLAREISGEVPVIKKIMRSLGYFRPGSQEIALKADLFKDQNLWESVLAHEIGHLMDYNPDKTMARGNILGRIASLREYRKSLLPEGPGMEDTLLTPKDRQRFRSEAEKIAKGQKPMEQGPDREFNPQAILDVWNNITGDIDPDLLTYIKGIDADQKKNLIKGAMMALKNGEKITVYDINKFNKDAAKNLKTVADIYRDILKKEIKKRKLWENEVIREEFKNLSQYWKPFNQFADKSYTDYRFSSQELYADFMSVLLNAPAKAKQIAPNGYQAFFNYIEEKPEVMSAFMETQLLVQADDEDLQNIRYQDILDMFQKGEQASRDLQIKLEKSKKSVFDKLRVLFWDKNSILLDERKKLKKNENIPPANDAKYLIEEYSMMGSYVKSFIEDIERLVYSPAKEAGVSNEVKAILFLDRVAGDRSEMANPKGHTEETARQLIDYLKKTNPEGFKTANDLAEKSREWFKGISSLPGAEDLFTPEQMFVINQSNKYAPFRVQDYMKDYMSAGFSQQVGTFKDIGDPLTSTILKGVSQLVAIERNRITKNIVENTLLRSGLPMIPAKVTQYPGVFKIENPPDNDHGTIAYKSGGKWVAYHTDKYIADRFNNSATSEMGKVSTALNAILGNNFFRNLFITFNMNFQAANLIRDFMTTWKQVPDMTLAKAFRLYLNSIGTAKRYVKGQFDPLIQEMERNKALQLSLNSLILGKNSEEDEIERVMKRYGILDDPTIKFDETPIMKQIYKFADTVRYVGDVIESLPKIAGWKALDNMDKEERAYYVRNFVGTPNFRRSGTGTPVTNAIFMFSNIFKEGFRDLVEASFTNPKTRESYWTKTVEAEILPKILMAMAAAGFFDWLSRNIMDKKSEYTIKNIMDKTSEYVKTNYHVIPIGIDEKGNGITLTIPRDESGRMIGGLFWKMLNYGGNTNKNLSDIFAFGEGLLPNMAPGFSLLTAWTEFLSGGNPKDTFRSQDILTDQEKAAGGWYAFEPMVRWTLNQTGQVRLDIRDRLKDEPLYKEILSFTPVVQRFIRVSRAGEYEQAGAASAPIVKEQARRSLDIQQAARDAIREGKDVYDFVQGANSKEEMKKMKNSYTGAMNKFTNDPYVKSLISSASNEEKIAILKMARKGYATSDSFNEFIDSLMANKIISSKVAIEAMD
jgi:hypothetical protein